MKYNCKLCKYVSYDKSNYNRHIKSQSHIQNTSSVDSMLTVVDCNDQPKISYNKVREFICQNCGIELSSSSSLSRHRNKYCSKSNIDVVLDELKEIKEKNKEIQTELKCLKNSNTTNNTYNISIKKYIQQNCTEAPPLTKLNDYSIMYEDDDIMLNNLVYYYNIKLLPQYLGDFIVKYYKKDNCSQQSIWNSDVSRLTYFIKELLSNKKSIWNHDYKGIKTKEYIIDPMLKYIKDTIDNYISQLTDIIKKLNNNEYEKIIQKHVSICHVLRYIDNDLADDINKYIAPHFQLNKNEILLINNE